LRQHLSLWLYRSQAFLQAHAIQACQDSSNRSRRFFRNQVRHDLLPELERKYNPQLRPQLAQLAQILREDLNLLELEARKTFGRMGSVSKGKVTFQRLALQSLPVSLRQALYRVAVHRLISDLPDFSFGHWRKVDQLLEQGVGGAVDLPGGMKASVDRASLKLTVI